MKRTRFLGETSVYRDFVQVSEQEDTIPYTLLFACAISDVITAKHVNEYTYKTSNVL
jgi:hypothetical protein